MEPLFDKALYTNGTWFAWKEAGTVKLLCTDVINLSQAVIGSLSKRPRSTLQVSHSVPFCRGFLLFANFRSSSGVRPDSTTRLKANPQAGSIYARRLSSDTEERVS